MTILLSSLPSSRRPVGIDSYADNPAMVVGNIPDNMLLAQQYSALQDVFTKIPNITIHILPFPEGSDLFDFVFVRDSFVSNQSNVIIMSHFHETKRADEVSYMYTHLHRYIQKYTLPYRIVMCDDPTAYIEGGEFRYIPTSNILIVGASRNTQAGIDFVCQTFQIPDTHYFVLQGKGFHVDVYCSVVTNIDGYLRYIIVCTELVDDIEINRLRLWAQTHQVQVLTVGPEYGIGLDGHGKLATNTLNIRNHLIGCAFFPPDIEKILSDSGVCRHIVDVSEYMKSGGAIHCLTNVL